MVFLFLICDAYSVTTSYTQRSSALHSLHIKHAEHPYLRTPSNYLIMYLFFVLISDGVPMQLANKVRLPPTNSPFTIPALLNECAGQVYFAFLRKDIKKDKTEMESIK